MTSFQNAFDASSILLLKNPERVEKLGGKMR